MGLDFSIEGRIEYVNTLEQAESQEFEVCYWRKDYGIRDRLINKYIRKNTEKDDTDICDDYLVAFDMNDIPDIIQELFNYAMDVDNIYSIWDNREESCNCLEQIVNLQKLKFFCDDIYHNEELKDVFGINCDRIKKVTKIDLYFINSY